MQIEIPPKFLSGRWLWNTMVIDDYPGSFNAILGPNGSGKSTLLADIQDVIPKSYFYTQDLDRHSEILVSDFIKLNEIDVPEKGYFDIGYLLSKPCYTLSGGEWSRVRLSVLEYLPFRHFLLDEPSLHLDGYYSHRLVKFIEEFLKKGLSVTLTTHDAYFFSSIKPKLTKTINLKSSGS